MFAPFPLLAVHRLSAPQTAQSPAKNFALTWIGAICVAQPRIAAMLDALRMFSPLGRTWVRDGFQEFPSQSWGGHLPLVVSMPAIVIFLSVRLQETAGVNHDGSRQ